MTNSSTEFLRGMEQWGPYVLLLSLLLFWIWESALPFFLLRDRVRHAARNLSIAVINAAIIGFILAGISVAATEVGRVHHFGLLRFAGLTGIPLIVAGFLILDIWMYWWHRLNHAIPFLWRFHRMHHSDASVDVTTAARFHFGEIVFSSTLRGVILLVSGAPLEAVFLYDLVQLPIIAFHHSNIGLSPELDRILRMLIVSPFMHKVHHSRLVHETDSNYSSVLSLWDRLFGSYVRKENYREIRFGLDGYDSEEKQTIFGLLRTPLFPLTRRSGMR